MQGIQGDKGDTGPPGPFPTGTLPSGVTLRGAFRTGGQVTAGGISQTSVSFLHRLSADPTPHFIPEDGTPPVECPGTVATPEAALGHLCLYEQFHSTTVGTSQSISNPVNNTSGQASRSGFGYSIQANGNGNFSSVGTWAVTAP